MPSNTSTSPRQTQHHHDHLAMHSHSVKNIKVAFFLNFGFCILEIYRGSSINERVVSWHLLEDVFGWVAVLIVSIILLFFDIPILDPLLSIVFTLFIVINIVRQLHKTLFIFLQGVPDNISLESITQELTAIEFVHSLHHSHIWTLEGSKNVFTTHIQLQKIETLAQLHQIKKQLASLLKKYNFEHCTIEVELDEETCRLEQTN